MTDISLTEWGIAKAFSETGAKTGVEEMAAFIEKTLRDQRNPEAAVRLLSADGLKNCLWLAEIIDNPDAC